MSLLAPKPNNWYDANGNMIYRLVDGAGQILSYDAENHLTSLQTSTGTSSFTYRCNGMSRGKRGWI